MTKLDGLTLLNTRPEHQAAHLTRLAESVGATVLTCPSIEIETLSLPAEAVTRFQRFDKIVFVSRNAVAVLNDLFQAVGQASPPFGESAQCFAIGQATQQALQAQGWPLAALDIDRFVSEDLLATEALQDLQGQRCLIVKGEGGRPTLKAGLENAGADVEEWLIYRRRPAALCAQAWSIFQSAAHPVVLASSLQAWSNLVAMVTETDSRETHPKNAQAWLFLQDIIVFSERIENAIREQGWRGRIFVVPQQSDDGVLSALKQISMQS
ncbi:hypothetical protein AVO42_02300 [Thiomicrospira sp. XS5]|uniref:uroporphyrinogen-III synthase n=1 Tax=Thiomicrospira sp. XS5 TaxID=1775636 RepID=UPI000748AAD1|nr:uroporphyrinogen-III synthase [Thiomicrospira sp. XS5]KUJ74267.1 hypothetical protein AVO42_02300 [Thiomicrospira sp. XS5]